MKHGGEIVGGMKKWPKFEGNEKSIEIEEV